MRRRDREEAEPLPRRLVHYRAIDWPDGGRRAWHEARLTFAAAHPDAGLGDPVDVLQAEVERRAGGADGPA